MVGTLPSLIFSEHVKSLGFETKKNKILLETTFVSEFCYDILMILFYVCVNERFYKILVSKRF